MSGGRDGKELAHGGMQISYLPISELKPDPNNPRSHSPRQIRQIARSIEAFGFNAPVLIDRTGKIIAGHGRVLACKRLGWKEVPAIRLEHLTEAQARAFMIADNRLTENSRWNDRLLAQQLRDLAAVDLDFGLDVTGFEIGEIDLRIEELSSSSPDDDTRANHIPEPGRGPTVSRSGDLWLLDDHRVLCGSALDPAGYAALMQDQKANMVFTAPACDVRIDGNEFRRFLAEACSLLARHSVAEALHYVCMDWRRMGELLAAGRELYGELKNVCVWVRDEAAGPGSFYRSGHELVFVFRCRGRGHRNNAQLGRNRTDVWNYPCANGDERLRPGVKPAAMVADAIMDCTNRRDIVLDSFLASGTTVIAAERTGRRCYGLESDPVYVDTIVRRWQEFTRGTAIHANGGRSFAELKVERA